MALRGNRLFAGRLRGLTIAGGPLDAARVLRASPEPDLRCWSDEAERWGECEAVERAVLRAMYDFARFLAFQTLEGRNNVKWARRWTLRLAAGDFGPRRVRPYRAEFDEQLRKWVVPAIERAAQGR